MAWCNLFRTDCGAQAAEAAFIGQGQVCGLGKIMIFDDGFGGAVVTEKGAGMDTGTAFAALGVDSCQLPGKSWR